jgi:hypothetical protein
MALSKAEASVGRVEAAWSKSAKITIVLLLLSRGLTLCLAILALRDEYVYKQSLKSHNKA